MNKQPVATAVVITHASELYGPPDALAHWLAGQETARVYVLKLPLDIGSNTTIEEITFGRGVELNRVSQKRFNFGLGRYWADIRYTKKFLRRLLRQHGVLDLLIAANPLNYLGASLAVPRRAIKTWVLYSVDYSPKRFHNPILNKIYRTIDDWSARRAHFVWNVSRRAIKVRQQLGSSAESLIHVPNGVPANLHLTVTKKDPNLVVFVGHLTLTKGLQDLLQAWPDIKAQRPAAKLEIIGSGPDATALQQIVRQHHLSDVTFLGQKSHQQTLNLLARATAGVALYNRQDSYTYYCDPMKVREYVATGVVPIVSDVPEVSLELVKHRAGEVVKEPTELAVKIITALDRAHTYQAGLKQMHRANEWPAIFERAFTAMKLQLVNRAANRILAVLWNPGEKDISAGGFRRAYEILKRFSVADGQLLILDSDPSIMKGVESDSIKLITYHIPRFVVWLEQKTFKLGRSLNWLIAMVKITWYGWRLVDRYDIVYLPYSEILVTSFGAATLKLLTGKRVVYCNENTDSRVWAAVLNNFIHNHVDRVMTISKDLAHDLNKQGIRGQLPVNYTGIDLSMLRQIPNQSKKYDAIFIGRHVETKGVYDYVNMLPALVRRFPNFKLVSVGACTPEMKLDLENRLTQKGLLDHWVFKGIVTEAEKYRLIKQSKTAWFLSTMEGWGIVPQEALGCHILPLCYDLPVYKESIRSCEAVSFVETGDVKGAVKAAIDLLTLPEAKRAELADMGAKFVERFSWEAIAKREFDLAQGVELAATPAEEEQLLKSHHATS
ncbi:MAG: glycosyltransferase [bacterium]|nr:glycosyltransferase [bacterium]